jgi:hypothetical protein
LEPFGRLLALELVSEPEAAALAVLNTPVITQRPDIIEVSQIIYSARDYLLILVYSLGTFTLWLIAAEAPL